MRKSYFVIALLLVSISFIRGVSWGMDFRPVTDFSDWEQLQWKPNNPVQINVSGSTISLVADGTSDAAWGALANTFEGCIGILGQVNISQASGNCFIGIRKYVAKVGSEDRLCAEMYLQRYSDRYQIQYRIREKDSSGNTIRQLAAGVIGEWDLGEENWLGSDTFLALALVGNEVWFYTPGYDNLLKVQILMDFTPYDGYVGVMGWADSGSTNHIEGTVKNVMIIYP